MFKQFPRLLVLSLLIAGEFAFVLPSYGASTAALTWNGSGDTCNIVSNTVCTFTIPDTTAFGEHKPANVTAIASILSRGAAPCPSITITDNDTPAHTWVSVVALCHVFSGIAYTAAFYRSTPNGFNQATTTVTVTFNSIQDDIRGKGNGVTDFYTITSAPITDSNFFTSVTSGGLATITHQSTPFLFIAALTSPTAGP